MRCGRSLRCQLNMNKKRKQTHGMSGTRIHRIWMGMRQRCSENETNPKLINNYYCRGIKVCVRWQKFENFFIDMGHPPSPAHSIDRIDNDKGYEPKNCRWATAKTQMDNRRTTRWITFRGETKTLYDWCDRLGLPRHRTVHRLYLAKNKWTVEQAFKLPSKRGRFHHFYSGVKGETKLKYKWSAE